MIFKKVISVIVMLSMVACLTVSVSCESTSQVNVNFNSVKQEIDGFGASQAGWSESITKLGEANKQAVMDLLFTQQGIDLDILRGVISPKYNPSKNTFDFTQMPEQAWVMQEANARGVDKFIATTWSPPAWMKDNNQTTKGGKLKTDCYNDYAKLLSEFVTQFETLYGIDFYAISIANEPNSWKFLTWDSCEWSGEQMRDFIKNNLKPSFEEYGIQDTKVIATEHSMWTERLAVPILNDPQSCARLNIVAAHSYNVPIINKPLAIQKFTQAAAKGKKTWMTEVSHVNSYDPGMNSALYWAKNIQEFMTKAEVSAWLYWTGVITGNNDEGLICADHANDTFTVTKRFYAMGQYSKFIKPGYVRIDATSNPVSGLYVSSYKDPVSGKVVIVAVNDSTVAKSIEIVPNGFAPASFASYITNETSNIADNGVIVPTNNQLIAEVPARSIVTYISE